MTTKTKETALAIPDITLPAQSIPVADIVRVITGTIQIAKEVLAYHIKEGDYDSATGGTNLAAKLNNAIKIRDAQRKDVTADSRRYTKAVNAVYKPSEELTSEAEAHIDNERRIFKAKEDAKYAEEQRKADAKVAMKQKVSIKKGGDGSKVTPTEQPINQYKLKSTDTVRTIPDPKKIQATLDQITKNMEFPSPLEMPGVMFYPEWRFKIIDAALVPEDFRKPSFVDGSPGR